MIKAPHPALDLSFMRVLPKGQGIDSWDVITTGYAEDCIRGRKFGREYLEYIAKHPTWGSTTMLGPITRDMGLPHTGLTIGFLAEVNEHALFAARLIYGQEAGSGAQHDPEASIARLFGIWKQHRREVELAETEEAVNAASDAAFEVGQRILKTPAVTARDFAMKVIVSTTADAFEIDADLMKEAFDLADYQRGGE